MIAKAGKTHGLMFYVNDSKKKKKKKKKIENFNFFSLETIQIFVNSHVFFTLMTEKKKITFSFLTPAENVGQILCDSLLE